MEAPSHSQSIDISDLNDLLHDLIDAYRVKNDELLMYPVLRCITNLIQNKNVNLCSKIFEKLISVMIAGCDGNADPASSMHHQLATKILTCVQLQVTKFPSAKGKLWLDQLWSLTCNSEQVHPLAEEILDHLFDDFVSDLGRCLQFLRITQQLLQAKEKKNREKAFIFMHKLEKAFNTIEVIGNNIKCTHQQWVDYIAAMEHLEEQQMPIKLISFLDDIDSVNDFSYWLRILLVRLLQLENISIVYETIKYIVANFKLTQLIEWNLAEPFLAATNIIQLYDVNEDDRLCTVFKNLILYEVEPFIEVLAHVPWRWHDVSLCEWLHSVPKETIQPLPCIKKDLLFQLGVRVKEIQNYRLRKIAQKMVEDKFQASFDNLSLKDYLTYIQMMYKNTNYAYFDNDRLTRLVYNCDNFEIAIKSCTKDFLYEIVNCFINVNLADAFIAKLRTVSKANHGLLRIFLLSLGYNDPMLYDLYSTEYGVNLPLIYAENDLKKLQRHLLDKLMCKSSEEKSLLLKVSLHLFVQMHLKKWSDMETLQLKPLQLLTHENEKLLYTMGWLLQECNERLKDDNVLTAFVTLLQKYPGGSTAYRIARYASKHLTLEEQYTLSENIISYHIHCNPDVVKGILRIRLRVPLHQVVQGIIHFSTLSHDACIEANYEISNGLEPISGCFIDYVVNQNEHFQKQVISELLHMNKELSKSHPQYLRNSKEHRLKFCIAWGLLFIGERSHNLDPLWSELFSSNDLINIKRIYEGIVAITLRKPDELIERLQSISRLQTSQQMSLLSVTYTYLNNQRNTLSKQELKRVIELLLPLTMEQDLQVHEFSQLILHKLYVMYKQKEPKPQIDNTSPTSIEPDLADTSIGPVLKGCILMSSLGSYATVWTSLVQLK